MYSDVFIFYYLTMYNFVQIDICLLYTDMGVQRLNARLRDVMTIIVFSFRYSQTVSLRQTIGNTCFRFKKQSPLFCRQDHLQERTKPMLAEPDMSGFIVCITVIVHVTK